MRFLLLAAVLLGVAVPSASARAPRPAVCLSLSAFGPVGAVDLGWPVAAGPACLPDPTGGTSVGRLVLPRVRFTKIAVGGAHACAVTGAGKVICWGDDSAGQTAVPAGVRSPRAVTAGAKHTCVITKTRGVTCWGEDGAGQADPPKFPKPVIAISAGAYHTCAVISGGGVSCWGSDEYGQSSPPSTIGAFESISAGAYHTCAVETSGDVACWGPNLP